MKTKPDTTGIEKKLKEYYPTGVYAKLAKTGEYIETTETVLHLFNQKLQKAREEEKQRIYSLQSECREENLFSHRNRLCVCYQSQLNQDIKIKAGAKDFSNRFETVMKELAE